MSQRPKLLTGTHFPKAEKSSSSNLVFPDIVLSPKRETMYLPKSLELGKEIQERNFLPSYSLPTFSLFYVCAPSPAKEGEKERESKNKGKQTRSGNVCLRLAGEEGWVPPSFLRQEEGGIWMGGRKGRPRRDSPKTLLPRYISVCSYWEDSAMGESCSCSSSPPPSFFS